jgi:peptidoglycan/LPS O-acetylase OafA/YrhL
MIRRFFGGKTVADRIVDTGGRTSGFDYMRIALATFVVFVHAIQTSYGDAYMHRLFWNGFWRPIALAAMPMFFALSGFLVAGSLFRCKTTTEFVMLRVLRIIPALFIEVMLSAFVLGALVTSLPLKEYFTNPEFLAYPFNIIGWIHYDLPGVFANNPYPSKVNLQLWTIPSELHCYIAIVGLFLLGFIKRPQWILVMVCACTIVMPVDDLIRHHAAWVEDTMPPKGLILSFLVGVVIYLFKDRVYWNKYLFAATAVVTYAMLYNRGMEYLSALPVGYMTVYLGLCNPRKSILTKLSDYSYGLYLYGFPIQQTYAYLFPGYEIWWLNFIFCMIVGLIGAAISWHFVESRVLGHRKLIIAKVEKAVGGIHKVSRLGKRAALAPRPTISE